MTNRWLAVLLLPVGLWSGGKSSAPTESQNPKPPYAARRAAALARLGSGVLIVPSQASFKHDDRLGFEQATDFYYLTGIDDVVGAVLVIDGASHRSTVYLADRNPALTRPVPTSATASAQGLGVDQIQPIDSLEPWLRKRLPSAKTVLVSPTDPRGSVKVPIPMANGVVRWGSYLTTLGWKGTATSAVDLIRPLREIKDRGEIEILTRVGESSAKAMLAGMRALKPGRTQREVELEVIKSCVETGGRHSFWPWSMTGPHAVYTDLFNSFVDYEGHNRAMQAGEVARVDVGCQIDHYMGDVGRTAPVSGVFTPGQREAWDIFIAGYRTGLTAIKDGAKTTEVYAAMLAKVRTLAPSLKTPTGKKAAEILLGPTGTEAWEIHGVGLDDAEGMPAVLKAGMVVAYELMYAVDGFGLYLEDMILVEPSGNRVLTAGLPYTATEIEAAMKRK